MIFVLIFEPAEFPPEFALLLAPRAEPPPAPSPSPDFPESSTVPTGWGLLFASRASAGFVGSSVEEGRRVWGRACGFALSLEERLVVLPEARSEEELGS